MHCITEHDEHLDDLRWIMTLQTGQHAVAVNAGVRQYQTVKQNTHIGFISIHHMQSAGFSNPKHNLTRNKVPAATLNESYTKGRLTNISELDQNNTGHKRTLLTS